MINRITPEHIDSLKENEIFVFGSNAKGFHGKGAALFARNNFGAIYGQSRGFQGQSYAIVTKKDWKRKKSSTLEEIKIEIDQFIDFAENNQNLIFKVTKLGCENAGYSIKQIAPLFRKAVRIKNIHLPIEFWDVLNEGSDLENTQTYF